MRIAPARRIRARWTGMILLALVMVLGLTANVLADSFTDVATNPYATAINDLASRQIISGVGGGLFKPDEAVKRQQFAKMIVLTLGLDIPATAACPFTDVDTTPSATDPLYPAKYVAACASHGITTGKTPTTFDPAGPITRQQLITMVTRAAALPDPPATFVPRFTEIQFSTHEHYLNAIKADAAGFLAGLVGVGAGYDFSAASNRGECAQLLYNLLQSKESLLPGYADLRPTGPVGYDFQVHADNFTGVEGGAAGTWSETVAGGTMDGHMTIEMISIQGTDITLKLVVDRLQLPPSAAESQAGVDDMLPLSLRFKVDAQGVVSSVFVSAAAQPEDEIQAQFVDALSTVLAPVLRAVLTPYTGKLSAPGDSVHATAAPTKNNRKLMDVAAQIDFASITGDVARLNWDLDITNIDIPLNIDVKSIMPLFGYHTNFGSAQWNMQMILGKEILTQGTYDLDVTTGMPKAMTLESTMQLYITGVVVPPEFKALQPGSHFFQGQVDHAYVDPMRVQMTLTRD
jgi:hypothetical protein